jgi:hypothetical protein
VLLAALVITDERLDEDARARVFRLRPQSIKSVQAWLDELMAGGADPDAIADDQATETDQDAESIDSR